MFSIYYTCLGCKRQITKLTQKFRCLVSLAESTIKAPESHTHLLYIVHKSFSISQKTLDSLRDWVYSKVNAKHYETL